MSGLAKFATTAYPVSGPVESLHEVGEGYQGINSFYVVAVFSSDNARHSACDGPHCSRSGVGLYGQAEELCNQGKSVGSVVFSTCVCVDEVAD